MRRDFCDIRVNILFKQGTLHPGQRFAFFTKTLLACELHRLFQDADTVLKFCNIPVFFLHHICKILTLSHSFLHHGNCQSAKLFRVTGGTEKRDIHAMDYTTSHMDIHYISLSYCVALSIFGFFLVYPFCQVMPFHLLPVNPTDQPVKLILCEMPCGITFPGPVEASPVQSSGTQPYAMFVPPENFYAGADFIGEDKSSTVMPCSVKFVLDVLCQCVDTPAHIDGFYDQEYVIRRQHGEEPGKHRLTEKAGSTSGYLREGKV
ncbi:hypothetical protein BvCmsNSNP036_00101 [Escherichia coli]|nr:hypothetical protein BvCmsNSNP036_00101 [Escherichia coli]